MKIIESFGGQIEFSGNELRILLDLRDLRTTNYTGLSVLELARPISPQIVDLSEYSGEFKFYEKRTGQDIEIVSFDVDIKYGNSRNKPVTLLVSGALSKKLEGNLERLRDIATNPNTPEKILEKMYGIGWQHKRERFSSDISNLPKLNANDFPNTPSCNICRAITVRCGKGFRCLNCGNSI